MATAPPPQTPFAKPPPPLPRLALRSARGVVTPLPQRNCTLGREGCLDVGITSPQVSRQQAELVRGADGGLRVVSRGRVNPTVVVRGAGEVVSLARGQAAVVSPGDSIILRAERVLREGAGALVGSDEAFTLVEAGLEDLPAALCAGSARRGHRVGVTRHRRLRASRRRRVDAPRSRDSPGEIARLRAELAAARAPATAPMDEEPDLPSPKISHDMEAKAAPAPTEAPMDVDQGPATPAASQSTDALQIASQGSTASQIASQSSSSVAPSHANGDVRSDPMTDADEAAGDAPAAATTDAPPVDGLDALTFAGELRAAGRLDVESITYSETGQRFAVRWRGGGGASCVTVSDGTWTVRDSGAASDRERLARALGLAGALANPTAAKVPRSGVSRDVIAFLETGAPPRLLPRPPVDDDDDSDGDFEDLCATEMLAADELYSEGEDEVSCYEEDKKDASDPLQTRGYFYVEHILQSAAAAKGVRVTAVRWDGSLRGIVANGSDAIEVKVSVQLAGDAVVLRATCGGAWDETPAHRSLVDSVPALQLLRRAAAEPSKVARAADVAADAAAIVRDRRGFDSKVRSRRRRGDSTARRRNSSTGRRNGSPIAPARRSLGPSPTSCSTPWRPPPRCREII